MRATAIVLLLGLGSLPVLAAAGVSWLGADGADNARVDGNDSDVAPASTAPGSAAHATLELLALQSRRTAVGSWGDLIAADELAVFHHVRVRLANDGEQDLRLHTRQFFAYDEAGREWRAPSGLTHAIDRARLAPGEAELGTVVFEMPLDAPLTRIEWRGAHSTADASVPRPMVAQQVGSQAGVLPT